MTADSPIRDPIEHDIRCPECVKIECLCPRGYLALAVTCLCGWIGMLVCPQCSGARPRCARCGAAIGKNLPKID